MSKHSPAETAVVIPPMKDADMGALLTEQYHKACNAMPEILRFGGMLLMLQEKLAHDGPVSKGGRGNEGGMRDWLRKHAPEVAYSTVCRFRDVTLGIAESYKEIVGGKIAKQFTLPALVTAAPEALPEAARKKQQALFEYVAGTSQKSWLDKMRPAKEKGGKTYDRDGTKGKHRKLTAEEARKLLHAVLTNTAQHLRFYFDQRAYVTAEDDAELDGLIDHLGECLKVTQAWRKLSKTDRTAALAEAVKLQIAGGKE